MIQPYSLFFVSFLLLSSFVSAQRGLKKGKEKSEALTTRYSDFDVSIDSFEEQKPRSKGGVKGVKGAKGTKGTTGNNLDATGTRDGPSNSLTLTLVNQSYKQTFGSIFVLVHNQDATPLFRAGYPASEALGLFAQGNSPNYLVESYSESPGVLSATVYESTFDNKNTTSAITISTTPAYSYVTIATMAVNTNDCFVAINGMQLSAGMVVDLSGMDAGSEENNELCSSIPGPACPGSDNVASGNGEGFVHLHRGFFGVGGTLSAAEYDWKNPMMTVIVS